MRLDTHDTIVAIATGPGGAARGIVRISGMDSLKLLSSCFHSSVEPSEVTRAAAVEGTLKLSGLGEIPCQALIWPDCRSYTRQPSVELHLVGSRPILEAALHAVCQSGGRLAEPGEFTLRAFLAGRLDLTQAEAVLGVIQANSSEQLEASLWQLAGGLGGPLCELRDSLLDLLAHLEAGLDFVEEDIEFISSQQLLMQLAENEKRIRTIGRQLELRREHDDNARVVLRGPPNVGKSSLLNALADEGAAIVSDIAGTTTDYVSRRVTLSGIDCTLIDTAGIDDRQTDQPIHASAQRFTTEQGEAARLEIFCVDSSRPVTHEANELPRPGPERLLVATKDDIAHDQHPALKVDLRVSSHSGRGIEALRSLIAERLQRTTRTAVVSGTATRCQDSVRLATESIQRATAAAQDSLGEELVAAELRVALNELGRVVGTVYTDDVLDRVFSRFCIGK